VQDGVVTIGDLQTLPSWPRGLAFLSACRTADATGDLPDEAVHFASALQLLGFEQVVATVWPVPDDVARAVTERFYDLLVPVDGRARGHADPAAALHRSTLAVLADDPANPFPWAYLHYGTGWHAQ
jgi:CHAT domain-containing protein